ncbi:MAG: hypothetical protein AVO35_04895 [Candidatus Aegiribacteria sp. MLS_C]|nr:MAG: hypothetical protein AVO35_04895 [Candidatus Aegiribacteria sp. MLS_C]
MRLIDRTGVTRQVAGFLFAAVFLLLSYGSILSHSFWDEDDFTYVSVAVDHDAPTYIFDRSYYVQMFPRPVTHLYFWVLSVFSGPTPWPYFLANLLLYAGSAVLVLRLVENLTGRMTVGAAAALFYLLSPCATDNLYWVAAGATGFLSGFLVLLTADLYTRHEYASSLRVRILALVAALLAMGSKESALSLPILLTVLDFTVDRGREGRLKRLLPFYILTGFFVLNVVMVQLSYPDDANFTRYGLSWMIPRNLLHFVVYPLVASMPPDTGEYTVLKMVLYPLLWLSTLFLGSRDARRLVLQGFLWIATVSLPFLPWTMGFQGFFPGLCDIPSRYFNLPSIGAAFVMAGFVMMMRDRIGRTASWAAACILFAALGTGGVIWTREAVKPMQEGASTDRCLVDAALECWDGSGTLYIGAFGFRPQRIESYNRMYFDGNLVQCQPFPGMVRTGDRMLVGPKTSPALYVYDGRTWRVQRTFQNCDMTTQRSGP